MLSRRAYRGELILTATDSGHLDLLVNLMLDLHDLGLEHTLVLMDREESCARAEGCAEGCTWTHFLQDEHPTPYWNPVIRLWLLRWLLFNSLVRTSANSPLRGHCQFAGWRARPTLSMPRQLQ